MVTENSNKVEQEGGRGGGEGGGRTRREFRRVLAG